MELEEYSNLYDIEFLGLLIEINKLIDNFSKGDKLKIKSWLKVLISPIKTIEIKKKRNLHAIVLLDNLINNKLNFPFTKFAYSQNDMTYIPVEIVKAELSKKFKQKYSSEMIELQGKNQKIKLERESLGDPGIEGEEMEEPFNNRNMNIDSVIRKELRSKPKAKGNPLQESKFKLESIIMGLEEVLQEKESIINQLNNDIKGIKNKISELEAKAKIVVAHQAQTKKKKIK